MSGGQAIDCVQKRATRAAGNMLGSQKWDSKTCGYASFCATSHAEHPSRKVWKSQCTLCIFTLVCSAVELLLARPLGHSKFLVRKYHSTISFGVCEVRDLMCKMFHRIWIGAVVLGMISSRGSCFLAPTAATLKTRCQPSGFPAAVSSRVPKCESARSFAMSASGRR